MKKLYFLSLLCCLSSVASFAQVTTTLYCGGITTFKSGNTTATVRTSGNIKTTANTTRGYAVFDLSSIPAGATVTSCVTGFYVQTYGGSGTPSGWTTYGYAGDLSTVTSAPTLFADCISGTSLYTTTYGTSTGNKTLATTATADSFIAQHAGTTVSICWTHGNTRIYTISGYNGIGGASTTAVKHEPYLTITYVCSGVSSVTATAPTTPLCAGDNLSLTGNGTGVTSYLWQGPGGFSSTLESPSFTATATSSGVYTFTAYNSQGCPTSAFTNTVTVNSSALPIGGTASVCDGGTSLLTDATAGGTWASSNGTVATVSTTGLVSSIGQGTTVISYVCGTTATANFTVNPNPAPITGTDSVCAGAITTLSDMSGFGVWSSAPSSVATVDGSGNVRGIGAGIATVNYTYPATNCFAAYTVTVNPTPATIVGVSNECVGASNTLTDITPGGTWSSSIGSFATIDASGSVTGLSSGVTIISYTNNCGSATKPLQINPLPGPIAGRDSVCALSTTLYTDPNSGGAWTSSDNTIASVISGTVTGVYGGPVGISAESATITYTLPTNCYVTAPITVIKLPDPITGPTHTCPGATISLSDDVTGGTWSSHNNTVASVSATGIVTGESPDTVTITYTMPVGCFVSTNILVNHPPAPISGIAATCAGLTDTLTDDSLGGVWSTSNSSLATVDGSGVVTTISQGSVTISYTLPVSGCFATASQLVHPLPVPVITYDGSLNTFSTQTFYDAYQWYDGFSPINITPIAGATSPHLAVLYNEYYTVVVTDSFGCSNAAAPYDMVAVGVGNVVNNKDISVYPNPATGTLYIRAAVNVRAVIIDMKGSTLVEQANAKEVNVSSLADGAYLVELYSDNGQKLATEKFVKQ